MHTYIFTHTNNHAYMYPHTCAYTNTAHSAMALNDEHMQKGIFFDVYDEVSVI